MSAIDMIARGLAARAGARATAMAALPRGVLDGSIVAIGDSITANATDFSLTPSGTNSWLPKGIFTMLVARSGGRLRPVTIPGWPYVGSGISATGFGGVLVARGGSGYSPATTISIPGTYGVSGATAVPVIAGGTIVSATITNPGTGYLGQSPQVAVQDPGGGSGAVLLFQTAKAGEFAAGGINSAQALAYLPLLLNDGVPVARNALVLIGTNDAATGVSLAESKANIVELCRRLVAGGVRPIVIAVLARNGSAGAAAKKQAEALRLWQMHQLATLVPGTVVADPSPWLVDPAAGDTVPSAILADGLHPTSYGADLIAKLVWQQIGFLFPQAAPLTVATQSGWGGYDAAYNPHGNLLPQPVLAGSGTVPDATSEAPWTGSRMAGLFLARAAGGTGAGTAAASIVARADGRPGQRQRLAVSVSGASAGETYRLIWSSNGTFPTIGVQGGMSQSILQPGDHVIAAIDELTMSDVSNLKGLKLKLVAGNSSSFANAPAAATVVSGRLGTAAWSDYEDASFPAWTGDTLFLQTREMVIPAGTFYLTLMLEFVVGAAGAASFTAELSGASLRRLA